MGIILKYDARFFIADVKNGSGGFVGEYTTLGGLVDRINRDGDMKIYSSREFELVLKGK